MKNGKIRGFRPDKIDISPAEGLMVKSKITTINDGQRNNYTRNNLTKNPHNLEESLKNLNLAKEALTLVIKF